MEVLLDLMHMIQRLKPFMNFGGDWWHGNPAILTEKTKPIRKIEMARRYQETQNKIKSIKESGYNLVDIWEFDFKGRS